MTDAYLTTATAFVTVEQLNRSQWHATCPIGTWRTTGVQDYACAVADALWMAAGADLGVQSVDLAGTRMVLKWPEVL